MSARWKAHLFALAAIAVVLLVAFAGVNQMVSPFKSRRLPLGERKDIGELVASSRVCQTFVAEYPGLSRIEVILLDYGRQNTGPFFFHLRSTPDTRRDIVTLTHDASSVKNSDYHVFAFPPLADSARDPVVGDGFPDHSSLAKGYPARD